MRFMLKFGILLAISLNVSSLNAYKSQSQPPCHPLDPLSAVEIQEAVQIISSTLPTNQHHGTWAFYFVNLKEPPKALLLPYFLQGQAPPCNSPEIPRRVFVQLVEKKQNIVTEVIVNLLSNVVESWKVLPRGTQPTFTEEENVVGEEIVKADPQVHERCRQMGFPNMSLVVGEVWGVASLDTPELKSAKRPIILYMYGKLFDDDNHFAHPFDFAVSVDLASSKVIGIHNLPTHSDYDPDNRVGNVIPRTPCNYKPELRPSNFLRSDVRPVHLSQPEGPSYTIHGNEISWQKFKIRIGFNVREGPVIHQVSYQDGPIRRPLFYRMSVAELFVPYGDPRPPFHQKFPFDEGEFTVGLGAADLKVAGICRGGTVAYLTVPLNDEKGNPVTKPNALCIYEEDDGLLWAHSGRDGRVVHARSQRLTITFLTTLSNYDYKFSWHFHQDATIEFNVELHGIIGSQLLAQNVTDAGGFGVPVFPQINGQFHQHFVTLRLDMEIDGNINTVSTVDAVPLPDPTGSPKNPFGQGWTTVERVLRSPAEARTMINPLTGREWLIRNPTKVHPYTRKPMAWTLIPHNGLGNFVKKDSPLHPKCAYMDYNVWVTKYKDGQLFPSGFYVGEDTLPQWVAENPTEDLTRTDTVLWYTLGYTHVPRVEDFPVMPTQSTSIYLKPSNFFLENPCLDVPPPPS